MPDLWMDVDAALAEVPINILPLIGDTDFKTIATLLFDSPGLELYWHFSTPNGALVTTSVTPTSGGTYDLTSQGNGIYTIEMPASGGASINNDTEGIGWFTGIADGILPWRGPTVGFRDSDLNDKLIESAWSATRGLAGTALPDAAAEAAGGLYTRGSGAGQINQNANGQVDSRAVAVGSNAIDAAALAADAGTEIATAVWANGVRTITSLDEDSVTLDLDATIRGALGMSAANLDAQIGDLPTNAELATALADADNAVLAAIGALPSSAAIATAVLTSQLDEDYAADGVEPTLTQAIFALHQHAFNFAIEGVNYRVYRLDGTTEAFILTLNSDSAPTAAAR